MSLTKPSGGAHFEAHLAPIYQRGVASAGSEVDVSIVMPCLNEASALTACIEEALAALAAMGFSGEVLVVDNGSSDGSAVVAKAAGARVVHETERGYGNACRRGLREARGRFLVLGDADGTYDFSIVPKLVSLLNEGVDVVLGNRLEGDMEPGAMPWMHRRVGTPLLTGVINLLFKAGVGDVNCGIRAITRSAYSELGTAATGMEFASELVVRALQADMHLVEVPVAYRRRSGGDAKLRTWRDGWRHLRLIITSWITRSRHSPSSAARLAFAADAGLTVDLREAEGTDADRLYL